jgi:hypothetical protein
MAADTSSAAGSAIEVVWVAAAAFALRSAEPNFSKSPLAPATMSGAMLSNVIFDFLRRTVCETKRRDVCRSTNRNNQ